MFMYIISGTLVLFNRVIKSIKDFYNICIKNKHIKIVKNKILITSIIQKLEKINAEVYGLQNLLSISKNLILD